ncbi:uncharacterized protein LOC120536189 [Polypterus senegalus]|uniref:uncharacterized protein LOC120536189 n=1 Tax=Polypterus senegalus TaxID=55291 RepID=UPI00196570CE|nr:uncharacterized protein LOC120536189 [Polypterus senegalus]
MSQPSNRPPETDGPKVALRAAFFVTLTAVILIVPAEPLHLGELLVDKNVVREGDTVSFKCRTNSQNSAVNNLVHLYRNGEKVEIEPSGIELGITTFKLKGITMAQAGNYTCFYGTMTPENMRVTETNNLVSLTVIEYLLVLQADIKNLATGLADVTFKCFFSNLKKMSKGSFELHRNGALISTQRMNGKPGVDFILKGINVTSSEQYVCMCRTEDDFALRSPTFSFQGPNNAEESSTRQKNQLTEKATSGYAVRHTLTILVILLLLCIMSEAYGAHVYFAEKFLKCQTWFLSPNTPQFNHGDNL